MVSLRCGVCRLRSTSYQLGSRHAFHVSRVECNAALMGVLPHIPWSHGPVAGERGCFSLSAKSTFRRKSFVCSNPSIHGFADSAASPSHNNQVHSKRQNPQRHHHHHRIFDGILVQVYQLRSLRRDQKVKGRSWSSTRGFQGEMLKKSHPKSHLHVHPGIERSDVNCTSQMQSMVSARNVYFLACSSLRRIAAVRHSKKRASISNTVKKCKKPVILGKILSRQGSC